MPRKARLNPSAGEGAGEATGEAGGEGRGSLFDNPAPDTLIILYRQHPQTKQWVILAKLAPEEATEEYLLETFGGGAYRLQEKARNPETGKSVYTRSREIKVEGPPKAAVPVAPRPAVGVVGMPGTAAIPVQPMEESTPRQMMDSLLLNQLMDLMKAQREGQAALIESFRGRQGPDFVALLTAFVPLITAYLARPQKDPMETAREIAALATEKASPGSPLKDRLEELSMLRELTDGAGGGGPETMLGLAAKSLPSILEALQGAKAHDAARPPQRRIAGPRPQGGTVDWPKLIQQYGPLLNTQAAQGSGADRYAAVVWDQIPKAHRAAFVSWIRRPAVLDELLLTLPSAVPYRAWWEQWVEQVRLMSGAAVPEPEVPLPATVDPELEPPL